MHCYSLISTVFEGIEAGGLSTALLVFPLCLFETQVLQCTSPTCSFSVVELVEMLSVLHLAPIIVTQSHYCTSALEALALTCACLAHSGDLYDLVKEHDCSKSAVSEIVNETLCAIDDAWSHLLTFDHNRLLCPQKLSKYYTISLNLFCHMSQGPPNGEFLLYVTGHQLGWRIRLRALMGASGQCADARTIYGNLVAHFATCHLSLTPLGNFEVCQAMSQVTGPGELSEMVQYAAAIQRAGTLMSTIWGFIDCTIRHIPRPTWGQKAAYNGYKKHHALKYQAVMIPSCMLAHLFGLWEGRNTDPLLLAEYGLLDDCAKYCTILNGSTSHA